jgi:hypothetical protein
MAVTEIAPHTTQADATGRIELGTEFANKLYRITLQPDGNLLLEPMVAVHEREVWFYRNPEVQAMVQEGIRQSRAGDTVHLGSFAEYLDLEIDDDDDES